MDYVVNIWLDLAGAGRASARVEVQEGSLNLSPGAMRVTQGDTFTARLRFVDNATTPQALPENTVLALAGAPDDENLSADLVVFCDEFTKVTAEADVYYEGLLDLNTDELNAIFAATGAPDEVPLDIDVELQNADNSRRLTLRFQVVAVRQKYSGQAEPTPATPPYPTPSSLVTKVRGTVAIALGAAGHVVTGLDLDEAPAQVLPSLRIPSAEASGIDCWVVGEPTTDGFTVVFGAEIPAEGYKLDYLLVLP